MLKHESVRCSKRDVDLLIGSVKLICHHDFYAGINLFVVSGLLVIKDVGFN